MATAYDLWLSDHPGNRDIDCTCCGESTPVWSELGECPDCSEARRAAESDGALPWEAAYEPEAHDDALIAERAESARRHQLARDGRRSRIGALLAVLVVGGTK